MGALAGRAGRAGWARWAGYGAALLAACALSTAAAHGVHENVAEAFEAGGLRRGAIVRVRAAPPGRQGGAEGARAHPHRSACVPGAVSAPLSCGRMQRPQLAPSVAQLENALLMVMRALAAAPAGAPLPRERTRTEPARLLLDGAYKEVAGPRRRDAMRRQRLVRKLLSRKLDDMREQLIGYGGRRLWGGEANLFY